METDEAFRSLVRWRFRHFFVDETQDLNPLQHALLEQWRGGRPDICLVGDPRQAIYGWNGADHTTMTEVERVYPGVTVIGLTTNYRCSPQVVSAGAAALVAGGQIKCWGGNYYGGGYYGGGYGYSSYYAPVYYGPSYYSSGYYDDYYPGYSTVYYSRPVHRSYYGGGYRGHGYRDYGHRDYGRDYGHRASYYDRGRDYHH